MRAAFDISAPATISEFFKRLFEADFMPHGHCFFWRPDVLWLHVLSDVLIGVSYYAIPITLVWFVRQRRDVPFHWVFLMFGAFILLCGTTHFVGIWTMWHGTYRIEGLVKLLTAVVSVATAVALVPLLPQAIALPGLRSLNEQLNLRTTELAAVNATLDQRVVERTASLTAAQHQLIQAEKMSAIGQLASGVAHEVKNPLGIIMQGVDYLERKLQLKEGHAAEIAEIQQAVRRADHIVQGLLKFATPSERVRQLVSIDSVLAESLELISKQLLTQNIVVSMDVSPGVPPVLGDPNQLQQVFINLIINAVDAMPQGGQLVFHIQLMTLEALHPGVGQRGEDLFRPGTKVVAVEIKDTGVGMTKESIEKAFEPFFTTKGPREGTGLGLAITQAIVNQHGGLITLKSHPGQGTYVMLLLPIATEEPTRD